MTHSAAPGNHLSPPSLPPPVLFSLHAQPALIEDYITGREFTVGLLGDKRPRVLPPMEILFKDKSNTRPVYDFQIKQEWEKHVWYECPARGPQAAARKAPHWLGTFEGV